jgi:preprotein translocase subunit SecF
VARRRRIAAAATPTGPVDAAEDGPSNGEPDLSDDAELARQLRRERAVAAAASTPSRTGKAAHAAGRGRPAGKSSRPTGKRHR